MTVRQKIAIALLSAVLTLVVGIASVVVVYRLRDAIDAVDHTYAVIGHLEGVIGGLVDAETGQRGYIITGDSAYLQPYYAGRVAADSHFAVLRRLTSDNPEQQSRLDSLAALAARRQELLAQGITLRSGGDVAGASNIVRAGQGRLLMNDVRRVVARMEMAERSLLERRNERRADSRRLALVIIAAGTLGAFLLAFLSNRSIRRDVLAQQRVQAHIEQQAHALQDQAVELELANEQLQETTAQAEEARDAADVASRAKSDFLAVMSHELRTPLNAIVGYAELLHDGVAGPVNPMQQEQLQRVQLSANHLVQLVDEILSFSRLEAGRETVRAEPIDLAEVTREAGMLVEPVALAKGLRFELKTPGEPVPFESDAGKVRQVLVNLLSNAVKFTDRGEVGLASWVENGRVVFEVKDTGIGIAPENLQRAFEPFWQADQSATRKAGGAGLGLSVSQRLARALGGGVTVESKLGEGSRFQFWVPRADRASA